MIDREALTAALTATWSERVLDYEAVITAAARERLAQLPEKCPICRGNSGPASDTSCGTCGERGFLYPSALVERIAEQVYNGNLPTPTFDKQGRMIPFLTSLTPEAFRAIAVAVLDALNTEPALEDRNAFTLTEGQAKFLAEAQARFAAPEEAEPVPDRNSKGIW